MLVNFDIKWKKGQIHNTGSSINSDNYEFSKYILQILTMTAAWQILHASQGLENRVRNKAELSKLSDLQELVSIADRMETLYSGSYNSSWLKSRYIKETYQTSLRQCAQD